MNLAYKPYSLVPTDLVHIVVGPRRGMWVDRFKKSLKTNLVRGSSTVYVELHTIFQFCDIAILFKHCLWCYAFRSNMSKDRNPMQLN